MYNLKSNVQGLGWDCGSLSLSPSIGSFMEVAPLYDVEDAVWVVEIDGAELCAASLRELQDKMPRVQIKDYYPNGFGATRDGFLRDLGRVPYLPHYVISDRKKRQIDHYRQMQSTSPEPEVVVEKVLPPKSVVSHDEIMDLAAAGYRSPAIAESLKISLATVQRHKMAAHQAKDPRALVRSRRVVMRTKKNHDWTDEDDALLRRKAREHVSARQISLMIGCTRNAVIGRGRRLGVHFHGVGGNYHP
jgi:hypothetical protein